MLAIYHNCRSQLLLWTFINFLAAGKCTADEVRVVNIPVAYTEFHGKATLAFQRSGVVTDVPVIEGQLVCSQDIVCQQDDSVARSAAEISRHNAEDEVEVELSKVVLLHSRRELEIVLNGNQESPGTFTKSDVDRLRLDVRRAELAVEKAVQGQKLAQLTHQHSIAELGLFQIRSPFSGMIASLHVSKGDFVEAGRAIAELVDTRKLRVTGYMPSENAWTLTSGTRITVRLKRPSTQSDQEMKFDGQLKYISSKIEPLRDVVEFWGTVENRENKLRAGIEVSVDILVENQ